MACVKWYMGNASVVHVSRICIGLDKQPSNLGELLRILEATVSHLRLHLHWHFHALHPQR
jgi:hypothetical protein